jgi:hypothetical protein
VRSSVHPFIRGAGWGLFFSSFLFGSLCLGGAILVDPGILALFIWMATETLRALGQMRPPMSSSLSNFNVRKILIAADIESVGGLSWFSVGVHFRVWLVLYECQKRLGISKEYTN